MDVIFTKHSKNRAVQALIELRDRGFGSDTWMSEELCREIVQKYLPKMCLSDQVGILEAVRKSKKLKKATGNDGFSVKGGKVRKKAKRREKLPEVLLKKLEEIYPRDGTNYRAYAFFKTPRFEEICKEVSDFHPGAIMRGLIAIWKKNEKKNKDGIVYFAHDPARPTEFNIGFTKRTPEERFSDTGSKGRHWEIVLTLTNVSESEVHSLLAPWRDYSGRGSETFILDEIAQELIFKTFGKWLNI